MEWDKTNFAHQEMEDYYILEKENKEENNKKNQEHNTIPQKDSATNNTDNFSLAQKASSEKIESLEKKIQEKDQTIDKLKKILENSKDEPCIEESTSESLQVEYIDVTEKILDEDGKTEKIYQF